MKIGPGQPGLSGPKSTNSEGKSGRPKACFDKSLAEDRECLLAAVGAAAAAFSPVLSRTVPPHVGLLREVG